jgi:hypothetical protein
MVVDDEVEVAEASKLDGATGWLSADDEGGRYGSSGRVLCGSR